MTGPVSSRKAEAVADPDCIMVCEFIAREIAPEFTEVLKFQASSKI